ncbi:arginine vasopressin-induced protein 1 [Takifugu flavidus]|nr:arginine vasopressin-induced protein 1 [Takifugu flavidus]TWW78894.1 hypothetical protein D4764_11G0010150 [Takifugu flavidus]
MDTRPATPPASVVAGPSSLWRLADRRARKAGSANIFSNVNLCQLQRLFRAAGDQDAEQRAQLIWGHSDETELAQALIGLRARSHKRGPRGSRRDALGSHWLQAFNHLRIGENLPNNQKKDSLEDSDSEDGAQNRPDPHQHNSSMVLAESRGPAGTSERPGRPNSGLRRGGENDPERYLHRILH